VEAAEVGVEKGGDALAYRDGGDAGPVDRTACERDQITCGRLVEVSAGRQQKQPRRRVGPGPVGRELYDVELARVDFPIEFRWAIEQVALVARQQVVVSAPKMLLGSSVGFS
jgi:hypothetical protein